MSVNKVYQRRRKRANFSDAVEEEEETKKQCCLVPGTPSKAPRGVRRQTKNVYVKRPSTKKHATLEKDCDSLSGNSFATISLNAQQEINCDADIITMISSDEKNVLFPSCVASTGSEKERNSSITESACLDSAALNLNLSLDLNLRKEEEQNCAPGLKDLNVFLEQEYDSDITKGSCLGSTDSIGTSKDKERCFDGGERTFTCSPCLIDLNKSIYSFEEIDGPKEHVMQTVEGESTCLVSGGVIEGSGEFNKGLADCDSLLSHSVLEELPSMPVPSVETNGKFQFVQDSKKRKPKPKRKKHRPKVVIDGKPIKAKPTTPKKPPKQAREKKPKLATPKQTKEKKPRTVRKRKGLNSKDVIIEGNSLNPLETKNLVEIKSNMMIEVDENKAAVARALDFQSESLDAKPVDSAPPIITIKKRRSQRRRKLNLFNLITVRQTKNGKKKKRRPLTIYWCRGKRRSQMKRPQKLIGQATVRKTDLSPSINLSFGDKPTVEHHELLNNNNAVTYSNGFARFQVDNPTVTNNNGFVGFQDDNPIFTNYGLVGFQAGDPIVTNMRRYDASDSDEGEQLSTMGEMEVTMEESEAPTTSYGTTTIKSKGRRKRVISEKEINPFIQAMESLDISDAGALVLYRGTKKNISALVPYRVTKKKKPVKVDLDSNTMRAWHLLMGKDDGRSEEEESEEDKKWWQKERENMLCFVSLFNDRMYQIQGDRGFRKWNGSVLDSVVGVFLTQNVSDSFSSNAYMSLAAKFPVQPTTCQKRACDSVGSSIAAVQTEYNVEGHKYFVNEPEPEELGSATETLTSFFHIEEITSVYEYDESREMEHGNQILSSRESANLEGACGHISQSCSQDSLDMSLCSSNLEVDEMLGSQSQNMPTDAPVPPIDEAGQSQNTTMQPADAPKKEKSNSTIKSRNSKKAEDDFDWESLRIKCSTGPRSSDQMDSVDWEAVRLADVKELAEAIKERGQQNIIAGKIQKFLNELEEKHKSLDLEWLRNAPPDKAKEYLLKVDGLGLKSVECVRLLALKNVAFPVDVNVGRIVVRLGLVPLQPLPEELQLHLLDQYPIMDSIQKYLWPRLCTLDQETLYELHYQMITFGKVFCTKTKPNCNACPMRTDCKHFASAYASSRLALPGPSNKMQTSPEVPEGSTPNFNLLRRFLDSRQQTEIVEPCIEEPFELSPSQAQEAPQPQESELEYDSEGIPIIRLNTGNLKTNLWSYMINSNIMAEDGESSKALVALTPEAASIPPPKLKHASRLRTEHQVYELPRNHCLLEGLEQTEPDDVVQYHLAIWRPGETSESLVPPQTRCNSQEPELCDDQTCLSCNNIREENANIVRGTLLIPCRVAMRGSFPLNGTYFQVNEVFADHKTSLEPLKVPREFLYNLRTRTAYFGTSMHAICRGLSTTEQIQRLCWKGIICVRGFDQSTRTPKNLMRRFHCPPNKIKELGENGRTKEGSTRKAKQTSRD